MKRLFFVLLLSVLALLSAPLARAEVSQLGFTTEAQIVAPGVISGKLTVQTQDGTGSAVTLMETGHLILETSSPTGEFSSSETSWKPVTTLTMSKGTANRSFYYRDTTAGTYTLTVKNADSLSWTAATQNIIIGSGGGGDEDDPPSATTTPPADDDDADQSASGGTSSSSSHSSQADLTEAEDQVVAIGAGRARLATVGNPLEFHAEGKNLPNDMDFRWSFGDGAESSGERVSHTYAFAGDYQVILSGTYGADQEAVSRTSVKVIEPAISIARLDPQAGYLELKNAAKYEINLFGWFLNCDENRFAFPRDTIILSGQKLKIPLALTKCSLTANTWSLLGAGDKIFAQQKLTDSSISPAMLAELSQRIAFIAAELNNLSPQENNTPVMAVTSLPEESSTTANLPLAPVANVIILDDNSATSSWWRKVKSWLGR